uniref:rho GTPase-activating protein 12-like n=1 Tax=Myxine glutinosa TaxID=7769 RepID=UPI00358F1886
MSSLGKNEGEEMTESDRTMVEVKFDYSYTTEAGREVVIHQGDVFLLVNKTNDDWWQVRQLNNNMHIYVPVKYVNEVEDEGHCEEIYSTPFSDSGRYREACNGSDKLIDINKKALMPSKVKVYPDARLVGVVPSPLPACKSDPLCPVPSPRFNRPGRKQNSKRNAPDDGEVVNIPCTDGHSSPSSPSQSPALQCAFVVVASHSDPQTSGTGIWNDEHVSKNVGAFGGTHDSDSLGSSLEEHIGCDQRSTVSCLEASQRPPTSPIYANLLDLKMQLQSIDQPTDAYCLSTEDQKEGWEVHWDSTTSRTYYYNTATQECSWELPQRGFQDTVNDHDSPSRLGTPNVLPEGWQEEMNENGENSFLNTATQEKWWRSVDEMGTPYYYTDSGRTEWELPVEVQPPGPTPGSADQEGARKESLEEDKLLSKAGSQKSRWKADVEEKEIMTKVTSDHNHLSIADLALSKRSDLEKAGVLNKTKIMENGKKIRKNWMLAWVVMVADDLIFYKDPKTQTSWKHGATNSKPESCISLHGAQIEQSKEKSSKKKNVLLLRVPGGNEYLLQSDNEHTVKEWYQTIYSRQIKLAAIHGRQGKLSPAQCHVAEDEGSDEELERFGIIRDRGDSKRGKYEICGMALGTCHFVVHGTSSTISSYCKTFCITLLGTCLTHWGLWAWKPIHNAPSALSSHGLGRLPCDQHVTFTLHRRRFTNSHWQVCFDISFHLPSLFSTASERSLANPEVDRTRVIHKLRRFMTRRPTLQSLKDKGYIREQVFGCPLDTLCEREASTVPAFVQQCISAVEKRGLDIDGIYRVSGNLSVIQKLRFYVDHEEELDLSQSQWEDIHVITGAFKMFFRELPDPLFTHATFDQFVDAIKIKDYSHRLKCIKNAVKALPRENQDTMKTVFSHLINVMAHGSQNRMSSQNLAIVFGPTLLRPESDPVNMAVNTVYQNQIVDFILYSYDVIFGIKA